MMAQSLPPPPSRNFLVPITVPTTAWYDWGYGLVWGWIMSPKRYVEVLIPITCKCDIIWKKGLCACNQVKMRPLGWALIQDDWYPYKKPEETDTQEGWRPCDDRSRDQSDRAVRQGTPKTDGRKWGRGEGEVSLESQRDHGLLTPWFWTYRFQQLGE